VGTRTVSVRPKDQPNVALFYAASSPTQAICVHRPASVALAAGSVAYQEQRVPLLYCNGIGCGWRELRRCVSERGECTCKHEGSREEAPNSRSLELVLWLISLFSNFLVLFHGFRRFGF